MEDNVTYLFKKPIENHHNSESFWTSFFALCILATSRSGNILKIPSFSFYQDQTSWGFIEDGFLKIPSNLDFHQVIIEGKITPGFLHDIQVIPQDLLNLKPDIIIRNNRDIILIEIKTVGAQFSLNQKRLYQKLAKFINENGYNTSCYLLISAGHEGNETWYSIKDNTKEYHQFKILLWEQIFKQLRVGLPWHFLAHVLGDIENYYIHEDKYLNARSTQKADC